MSAVAIARLSALLDKFQGAGLENFRLYHAAVTEISAPPLSEAPWTLDDPQDIYDRGDLPTWPWIPVGDDCCSPGFELTHLVAIVRERHHHHIPLGSHWLFFDGRLWQGTFLVGACTGEEADYKLHENFAKIQIDGGKLPDGDRFVGFRALARDVIEAADWHTVAPAIAPAKRDFGLSKGGFFFHDDPAHRWLEMMYALGDTSESETLTNVLATTRRLRGDVFHASAKAIERLIERLSAGEQDHSEVKAAEPPAVISAGQTRARAKKGAPDQLIRSALLRHHAYSNGSILNDEPIGLRELHRQFAKAIPPQKISEGAISTWFKDNFKGHSPYEQACKSGRIAGLLKALAGDYRPDEMLALARMDRRERDDDE